jgi:hypothetical protein
MPRVRIYPGEIEGRTVSRDQASRAMQNPGALVVAVADSIAASMAVPTTLLY